MMHNPVTDQIRRLVEKAIEAEGVGARRFEEAHGLKPWALRGLLDPERKQAPSVDRAKEICEALGIEFYVGPRRTPQFGGLAESGDNDSRPIPWFEPRLGQGSSPVRFSLSWLQSVDLVIDNLRALIPDEVECPSFQGKDCLALIEDPSRPGPEPSWWAFRERTRVIVARMQRLEEVVVILPSGHDTGARVYTRTDPSFRPLGKVVWLSVVRPG